MIKKKIVEIHWSALNAHCVRRKATLYFLPAVAAKMESLVMDIVTDVLILPYYSPMFKRCALFS